MNVELDLDLDVGGVIRRGTGVSDSVGADNSGVVVGEFRVGEVVRYDIERLRAGECNHLGVGDGTVSFENHIRTAL